MFLKREALFRVVRISFYKDIKIQSGFLKLIRKVRRPIDLAII